MKFRNKLAVILAALMVSASFAACEKAPASSSSSDAASVASSATSSQTESTPASSDASSAASSDTAAPAGEMMSEEDYKAKVLELYTAVTTAAGEMATVDQTNQEAVIAATNKMIEATKAAYTEMGALVAPESFADAQAKIKEGVDASIQLLDLSAEMMTMSNLTADEAAKKATEVQTKMTELAPKAQAMTEALATILGDAMTATAPAAAPATTPAA